MITDFFRKAFLKFNKNSIKVNGRSAIIPTELYKFFSLRANNPIEPELNLFIKSNLKSGDVFIDIGANIGLVSLVASQKVGKDGLVIAFEPNPWVFKQFVELQRLNSLENVRSLELAASDSNGSCVLYMNDLDSMLMTRSSTKFQDDGARAVKVLTNKLDNIGLPDKVSMLKIDVEGAETSVIKGAVQTIDLYRPIVCLEIHGLFFDNPATEIEAIFKYFASIKYSCYNIHKRAEESFEEYMNNTAMPGADDISGKNFSKTGYGQLVFYPIEAEIIKT